MPDFARSLTGSAGYRVPADDPSFKGVYAAEIQALQERLNRATAGGGMGGFKLDVEQMQTLLPQWKDLRDTLVDLRRLGNNLKVVASPAADESSMANNNAVLTHAELYQRSIEQQRDYAIEYVKSIEKMIEKYQHADDSATRSFNVMGTEL
ncbi:hypothetical protein [Amycolatopsis sp. NPDC021455]|uniref:hypothetical protein n=1 Tax=Amycolatopsis sp. NPDC021455 TaxID=3154901 RepID=UPI0033E52350